MPSLTNRGVRNTTSGAVSLNRPIMAPGPCPPEASPLPAPGNCQRGRCRTTTIPRPDRAASPEGPPFVPVRGTGANRQRLRGRIAGNHGQPARKKSLRRPRPGCRDLRNPAVLGALREPLLTNTVVDSGVNRAAACRQNRLPKLPAATGLVLAAFCSSSASCHRLGPEARARTEHSPAGTR